MGEKTELCFCNSTSLDLSLPAVIETPTDNRFISAHNLCRLFISCGQIKLLDVCTRESVLCRTNQGHGNHIYHCNLVFQTTEPAIHHTAYLSLNFLVILAYNFSFLSFYQELSAIAPTTNDTPEDPDNIDIQ